MLIPVGWLKEFVSTDLPVDEICRKLTMAGLEIEGLDGDGDSAVMDVNVTPNRPDCLSVYGIARELAAITKQPLTEPSINFQESGEKADVTVTIDEPDLCARYSARVIKNVRVEPSPGWISERLQSVGIRPINNVVDITNYVLMELGHPLHAFDMANVAGGHIRVARAGAGEKFTALDSAVYELSETMLTIRDASGPVALAGIMGGQNSEVTGSTKDVILESAYFLPASVRITSRTLGLRSESSYRFERGTDIEGLIIALDRAAGLMSEVAGGSVCSGRVDVYPKPYSPPEISLSPDKVSRFLGVDLESPSIAELLERLNFRVASKRGTLSVVPPTYRRDAERDVDLVEEVARLYGYNNIPSRLPEGAVSSVGGNQRECFEKRLKDGLLKSGFSEAINFSFMNPAHLDLLGVKDGDSRRSLVVLENPLRSEEAVLRTSLVPSLLENLARNLNRGSGGLRLFELARIFFAREGEELPEERKCLAAVYSPALSKGLHPSPAPAFFELKGAVEAVFKDLKLDSVTFSTAGGIEPYLNPGMTARISAGNNAIGYIGGLQSSILKEFEIEAEACILDLDVDELYRNLPGPVKFRRLPKFPFVDRDMAFLMPVELESESIIVAARGLGENLILSVRVFDHYQGKGIPEGMKSLAYSVRYQSPERTLTVQEVDDVHSALISHLEKSLKIKLRGM